MKVKFIPIVKGTLGIATKGLIKLLEDMEITGRVDHLNIIEIGQNIEKSPGDLRRLAVAQTSVLADVKNFQRVNNNNNKE